MNFLKICILVLAATTFTACSSAPKQKPVPTQIVNGKSIVVPPDWDVLPESENIEPQPISNNYFD